MARNPRPIAPLLGFFEKDMASYPQSHYSKTKVNAAGEILRGTIPWSPGMSSDEITQVFNIAHDWRNAHVYPMRRIRQELAGRIKRIQASAITAARVKRMKSIRRKLQRLPMNLTQIQDLGGCRAILASVSEMEALVDTYRSSPSNHLIRNDTNYIQQPRPGGYRSHHFVLEFQGDEDQKIHDGKRIEVQIRTQLQHSWATAVEAIGLVRGEDLKGGEGDESWLRLFELMSSEFAEIEKCPLVPGTPDRPIRRDEIGQLNEKLNAAKTLENLAHAFRYIEDFIRGDAKYFLIQYDRAKEEVRVRGYAGSIDGTNQASRAEESSGSTDSVLVEIDQIANLKEAYPNYFGDVGNFVSHVNAVVHGSTTGGTPSETIMDAKKRAGYDVSFLNTPWRDRR